MVTPISKKKGANLKINGNLIVGKELSETPQKAEEIVWGVTRLLSESPSRGEGVTITNV